MAELSSFICFEVNNFFADYFPIPSSDFNAGIFNDLNLFLLPLQVNFTVLQSTWFVRILW